MSSAVGSSLRAQPRPSGLAWVQAHAWTAGLWAAMLAWSTSVFLVVRARFLDFSLARYDLGNMVQAVWSTAHGRPLEVTNGFTGEQMVRLGSHVDPILALLAPLWIVAPTPLLLAAVQIAAVAAGVLPLFWLARRRLRSETAAGLIALAYLVYPWTAWTAADAFHPVTLAIPLLLFCVWFLDTDRLGPFAVCAVLAASTGELVGVTIGALGIWYALARRRRRAGFAIAALGIGWSCTALLVVVPAFSGASSVFYGAYDDVGGSPWGVVATAVTEPSALARAATEPRDLLYLGFLAAPLAGAFLLAPGLAAVASPQLAANLLAGGVTGANNPHSHYVAGILPFLFAAIAVGLGRLAPDGRLRGAVLVLALALSSAIAGPWPGAVGGKPSWDDRPTPAELSARRDALELVPPRAAVAATNGLGSHLSARRYLSSVPVVGDADWLVVDSSDPWVPRAYGGAFDTRAFQAFLDRIERSPTWRKVFDERGVLVYRRSDR